MVKYPIKISGKNSMIWQFYSSLKLMDEIFPLWLAHPVEFSGIPTSNNLAVEKLRNFDGS
jgi:hypothetical protein